MASSEAVLLDAAIEQVTLLVGGLYAEDEIDSDLVWRMVGQLESIRDRMRDHVAQESDRHPAVEDFLFRLRGERPD